MTLSIEVTIVTAIIFVLSLLLNAVLIWYTKTSIVQFAFISENIQDLKDSIDSYAKHLETVYQLEMFYGDETLNALMEHTRRMQDSMTTYDDFYDLFGIEVADEEELEEEVADAATQTQG